MNKEKLIEKYNIPVPRYTSYPTLPYWNNCSPDTSKWIAVLQHVFNSSNNSKGISIYIHMPYCEKQCYYCACTKEITKNHDVEDSYIKALLEEWRIYLSIFKDKPLLKELHLGGGTPTFFSAKNLKELLSSILENVEIADNHEFSFEANPTNITEQHLITFYNLGFKRMSLGIQDFDPVVLKTINRTHTYKDVKKIIDAAREIGYESINCDLIYGLPKQKIKSIEQTFSSIQKINPDRIAFYSYAHVPWKSESQTIFEESDIPAGIEKRQLYEKGKEYLQNLGYHDIGMDHFALSHDNLYKSYKHKKLHRNFMGYTSSTTDLLIGLGASAISDAQLAYAQNTKNIELYKEAVFQGKFKHINSYFLTQEDQVLRRAIIDIACKRELQWNAHLKSILSDYVNDKLQRMSIEGIIKLTKNGFSVTDFGMIFLRNICSLFDMKLNSKKLENTLFSKSI